INIEMQVYQMKSKPGSFSEKMDALTQGGPSFIKDRGCSRSGRSKLRPVTFIIGGVRVETKPKVK
ncbi:hypothetical protein J6590_097359, partial [Homalodisca vitripennis]